MLIKKALICLSIFAMILVLAGLFHARLQKEQQDILVSPLLGRTYSMLAAPQVDQNRIRPFQPREYVRIIRKSRDS
ncbi:hypothetical protein FHS18_005549 [Paenibacillus phyllosphaerae]|uniref:Uncharacterized protein n=1 Tax=Paenibacillus phyllosphaerae TaxID=274593 RepID=A0A7W5B2W2_9BACL|nr:hypothetical protein [Paenibacillus phyllosphaerae]